MDPIHCYSGDFYENFICVRVTKDIKINQKIKLKLKLDLGLSSLKSMKKLEYLVLKNKQIFFFIEHYLTVNFHIHNFHIFPEKTKICIISYSNNHKY